MDEEEKILSELRVGGDEFELKVPSKVEIDHLAETFDAVVVENDDQETENEGDTDIKENEPVTDIENEPTGDTGDTATEDDEQEKETDVKESDEHIKRAESGELLTDEKQLEGEPEEDILGKGSEGALSAQTKETDEISDEDKGEKDTKADSDVVGRRIAQIMSDETPATAGDFKVQADSDPDFNMSGSGLLSMSSEESTVEEEEKIEEEIEEEEYIEPIDRERYLEMYRTLLQEKAILRRKNMVLHRKLVEYFRKRKMESAFGEYDSRGVDLDQKYYRKLYVYEELKTVEERERSTIKGILKELRDERNAVVEELRETLEKLIEKERQVGIGLINAQSGKPMPDKDVERLLNRQRQKAQEVGKVRLVYIKVRDRVAANEAVLRALETLGEGLHLIDYEQLRMENQNYDDKIEEREEELARLRTKATSSIQIVAHVREKSNATLADIEEVMDRLETIDSDVTREREYVGRLKHRRDFLREETLRLRNEAGLLTHHRLLRDFEESIEETTRVSAQLQNLKNTFHDQMRSLASVRKSINLAASGRMSGNESVSRSSLLLPKSRAQSVRSSSVLKTKSSVGSVSRVFGGRPSFFPAQHQKALDNFLNKSQY